MLDRYLSVILLCVVCTACGEKTEKNINEVVVEFEPAEAAEVDGRAAEMPSTPPITESTSPVSASAPNAAVLDLSLPADTGGKVQDWGDDGKGRYGVSTWFDQSKQTDEQRLKLKTKLRMKEGAEFDKNSDLSSYGDSVDGAEMGFEYKTR